MLVIAGPTGVGKTAAAVALAERVPIEVISADSRQVYRLLDAATGKPSAAERAAVPHHGIDVVDPDESYQAARFRAEALAAIERIRAARRLPVIVGGTGLYIRSVVRGLDPAPPRDPAFRQELEDEAAHAGPIALHRRLGMVAPLVAAKVHPNDRVRIIRALEVVRAGYAPAASQTEWRRATPAFRLLFVGLTLPRDDLAARVRERAAAMARNGLADEVQDLLRRYGAADLPALQGIGYRQFVHVVRGRMDAETAVRVMQRDTVQYVKRQLTWFAREPNVEWIDVDAAGGPIGVAGRIAARVDARGLLA